MQKNNIKKIVILTVMIMLILGIQVPTPVQASRYDGDVSKKSYTCNSSKNEYYFTGTTSDNNITVDCDNGTVKIHLTNVTIDMLEDNDDVQEIWHNWEAPEE